MPTTPSPEPASTSSSRLHALDALRGFDMFWIMGGDSWIHALAELTGWSVAIWGAMQMEHMAWDGFRFYDMIFPLFLFIAGVAMPFSLTRRLERGDNKRKLMGHVIRRGLILVVLGIIYNNGLFQYAWDEMRYPSVLGRIGLAYLFAGLIVLNTQWRSQGYWFVGLLLGYWAAMMWIPVPGHGAGQLTVEGNLAAYLDRLLLPGRLYLDVHDPEGLFATIPAISTALMGALTGNMLRSDTLNPNHKILLMVGAGVVFLLLGWLWNLNFPVNKNLWSSSFVLVAGGWSLTLLALFYTLIDVWGWKKWAFFFVVIGLNSITIYMANGLIQFRHIHAFFDKVLSQLLSEPERAILWWTGFILIEWAILYFLYRKKIFLRV